MVELILNEGADELRKEIDIASDIAVRICQTNQKMRELQRESDTRAELLYKWSWSRCLK